MVVGAAAFVAQAQDNLPFPLKASGSKAGETMQKSTYSPLPEKNHLPAGAPNLLIILMDDVGPG